MTEESSRYAFKHHPETCDPEDFWGQVKRTVAGKPVTQDQIDMIVAAAKNGLDLQADDVLLDLCCGNGALTTYLFQACRGGLGVDYSEFLIDVANKHFSHRPEETYRVSDVIDYVHAEEKPLRFTKVVCYGAFSYFPNETAQNLLRTLGSRFCTVTHIFVGNLPDKENIRTFYKHGNYKLGEEEDPGSLMGIWRTMDAFVQFASTCGWNARCEKMARNFYASHYRYDAILTRP